MPSPIAALTQNLSQLARPNKYRVEIVPPRALNSTPFSLLQSIGTNCSSASFPSSSFGTNERRSGGQPIYKLPYDKIYDPVTLSFYASVDHKERTFFEDWMNQINDGVSGRYNFYENYVSYVRIIQLDSLQLPQYAIELNEAYPTTLSDIQLGYEQENTIATFTVTFTYKYYKPLELEGGVVKSVIDFLNN